MNSILVTGSSGFIARHLIPHFQSAGAGVTGLDLLPSTLPESDVYAHVQGDIRDLSKVQKAMNGADSVIHLAAAHKDFGVPEEEYYSVNVDGTRTLLDHAANLGIRSFVFYSSVAVYGEKDGEAPEDADPAPTSHYGCSKLEAEGVIQEWVDADPGRQAIIVRPAVVIGPHNIANMFRLMKAIDRRMFIQIGEGSNRKSIAGVTNLVQATDFLMHNAGKGVTTVNYADKPDLTSKRISEVIATTLNKPIRRSPVSLPTILTLAKPLDVLARTTGLDLPITTARIRKYLTSTQFAADRIKALGFEPAHSTEDAVREMAEWYRQQA